MGRTLDSSRISIPWNFSRSRLATIAFAFFLLILVTVDLNRVPALWWDEGWTLNVARNWVEVGVYGQLLNGQPRSTGLSGAFPVIVPVALSFQLFGVGIWQGRLPGVLLLLANLALMYYLARRLYGPSIARGTLFVLLLMCVGPSLHPVLIARQVLGEMPALFYMLTGYVLLLEALTGRSWLLIPVVILWGIAVQTKAQILPFWLFSLLFPMVVCMFKRSWRSAAMLATGLILSQAAGQVVALGMEHLLAGKTFPGEAVKGIYSLSALVLDWRVRQHAWLIAFSVGLPTLVGLAIAAWKMLRELLQPKPVTDPDVPVQVVRLVLLSLSGAWFGWYVVLAMLWVRYLFPALFFGSIFTAVMLHELTFGYNLGLTVKNASAVLLKRRFSRYTLGALLAVFLLAMTVPLSVIYLYNAFNIGPAFPVRQVADFLNNETPPDSVIESYDSEVFFLLERGHKYHYPPDDLHLQYPRRLYGMPYTPIEYDPLEADPDYLVVGFTSTQWSVYDEILETGAFRLVHTFPPYRIYERVRPAAGSASSTTGATHP